ncbi:hypothetical protein OROMI_014028 [Orobanche minor]
MQRNFTLLQTVATAGTFSAISCWYGFMFGRGDEKAPGGTPVMQPSFPKERAIRHRPGLYNRMIEERGNRRERDPHANGNERFDRSENPQPGDFATSNDGVPGENQDEQTFAGKGIHVAPFPSDIPPPVLMPVPGAGPLGPFVPAPPKVAMRMFCEQGGPPPFEGGRNGSYNDDLDAPDDEATVIDYRSL